MTPQLRFSKDFDAFTVEPDHLDIVYGGKAFRLAYPINGERKFAVGTFGNTKLLFPAMLLECYNGEMSHGVLVNVQAGFDDVLMLGRFAEKLSSVAGYRQVRVDEVNFSAKMCCGSGRQDDIDEEDIDEEDIDEEDIDDDGSSLDRNLSKTFESTSEEMNVQPSRPTFMFVEERARRGRQQQRIVFNFPAPNANAGYFEITEPQSNVTYRFRHNQPVGNRTYENGPLGFGPAVNKRHKYLLHSVMLQAPPNPNNTHRDFEQHQLGQQPQVPFVDLAEVDVFVDLGDQSDDEWRAGIRDEHYHPI